MRFTRIIVVLAVLLAVMCGPLPAGAKEGSDVFYGPKKAASSHAPTLKKAVKKEVPAIGQSSDYLIGPEDVIEVSVWKNAALSKTVTVRPDGKISLPLIGDIKVAGFTPKQLKKIIEREVSKYQQTAIASVIVTEVNSYRIFILGEVASPGAYQMKTRTSVLQAIALAGGLTEFASGNKMQLIRKKKDGTGDEKIRIRFKDLVYKKGNNKNIIMKPGDTIFVP